MSNEEKRSWQDSVKNRHKEGIIALLQEQSNKAMRFIDLLAQKDRTGIKSPKGLTEVLGRLISEGLLEKTHIEIEVEKGKPKLGAHGEILERTMVKKKVEAYALTITGQNFKSWWLIHELLELKDKKAGYMHSPSNNYYSFGLSVDIVMSGKDKQLSLMLPTSTQIENYLMSLIFNNIKTKNLKIEPSDGKIILSYEIDFDKLANELISIQSFIEDINSDKDVFSDNSLYLSTTPNRLWVFDYLISCTQFFGDDKFRVNLVKYVKKLADAPTFTKTFGTVDFNFVERLTKSIISGKEPLENKNMLKKLIVKGEGNNVDMPLFAYIKVAKIKNFDKESVFAKLSAYEEQKNNENFDPNSKLHLLINQVRGEIK